ncbi:hypothetical protein M2254_002386 [Chryseobacterium sp. BIGb0186]|nr:hypothetical protein [Chryseobacterium sp. JUb44]MDH6210802.1 hypothetical protein [Chryseobacterium sp. BIGb0186]
MSEAGGLFSYQIRNCSISESFAYLRKMALVGLPSSSFHHPTLHKASSSLHIQA